MSTATSRMRPLVTRTSLSCAKGADWKCKPRSVPICPEKRMIVLDESEVDPRCSHVGLLVDLGEEAAMVAMLLRDDDLHCWDGSGLNAQHGMVASHRAAPRRSPR